MAGVGLSRMMQGAVQGYDEGMARRDRAATRERVDLNRQREDTQWEQGQQDRQYELGRRDIETGRADAEYQRLEQQRQNKILHNEGLKGLMMNDDVTNLNKYLQSQEMPYVVTPNKDGTYTYTNTKDPTDTKTLKKDEVGKLAMMIGNPDIAETIRARNSAQAEQEGKLELQRLKNKGGTDKASITAAGKVNAANMKAGGDGGVSKLDKEYLARYKVFKGGIAKLAGGSLDGLTYIVEDSKRPIAMAADYHGNTMINSGEKNIAKAQNEGWKIGQKANRMAKAEADKLKESGELIEDVYDDYVERKTLEIGEILTNQQYGGSAPALERQQPQASGTKTGGSMADYINLAVERAPKGMDRKEVVRMATERYKSKNGEAQ